MNKKRELSPWEQTCIRRLQTIIDMYCGGSQQRFVERTGLNKGSVSQYVNGKNVPSPANAEKIAAAFNVDVGWLLGYDLIPPGIDEPHLTEEWIEQREAMELWGLYKQLAPEDQTTVLALMKSLQSKNAGGK